MIAAVQAAASPGLEAPPSGTPVTRTTYDALGRTVEVFPPVTDHGPTSARTVYLPWPTQVFDERDGAEEAAQYPAISRLDGLGRLVEIVKYNDLHGCQAGETCIREEICVAICNTDLDCSVGNVCHGGACTSGSACTSDADCLAGELCHGAVCLGSSACQSAVTELSWQVSYDVLGNTTGIVDPQGFARAYAYDSMSRLRQINDPNAGTLAYTYDDAGNTLSRVDALGQRIDWQYEVGNRLLAQHTSLSAELLPDASYLFSYDAAGPLLPGAQNLLGRVSSVSTPIGEVAWSYDALGRVVTTVQTLNDSDDSGAPPLSTRGRRRG